MDYNIQALKGLKSLVLVTLDQSKSVAEVDAPSLSTRIQKYVQENTLSYFVVLNTWGHQIIANSSEEAWVYIWMHIQRVGLVPVIRDTSALADKIIHGEAPEWDYVYGYLSVLQGGIMQSQTALWPTCSAFCGIQKGSHRSMQTAFEAKA